MCKKIRLFQKNFNPRTPCGVRPDSVASQVRRLWNFNPRTPCGVRQKIWKYPQAERYFNPRTPCGVRLSSSFIAARSNGFQSTHPLRGATLMGTMVKSSFFGFQSTHPLRGATAVLWFHHQPIKISIHAPLAGCDHACQVFTPYASTYFNPRTPCGVRRLHPHIKVRQV